MEAEDKMSETAAARRAEALRLDALLDEALMDTFPASDPVAVGLGQHKAKAEANEPGSS